MKHLLRKEFRLAMHPTNVLFLSLSALLLIPNYPYYVTFFYTTLGIFFLCLNGRENHDMEYTLPLPLRKRTVVQARILFTVLIELCQLAIALPFALLRARMVPLGNEVGMDANVAFFGFSLLLLGLFHAVFFPLFYGAPTKVGKAFGWGATVYFLAMTVLEALTHTLPFFSDRLDTPDPQFLSVKLLILGAGALCYAAFTLLACHISVRRFEALDL